MITDALVSFLVGILQPVVDLLPDGQALALPDTSSIFAVLGEVNSVVPLSSVYAATATMLLLVIPFTAYRTIVHIRKMLLP